MSKKNKEGLKPEQYMLVKKLIQLQVQ